MTRTEKAVIDAAATLTARAGASALPFPAVPPAPVDPGKVAEFGARVSRYLKRRRGLRLALNAREAPDTPNLTADPTAMLVAYERAALNVFCPTGEGGGVDPTCSPGGKEAGEVAAEYGLGTAGRHQIKNIDRVAEASAGGTRVLAGSEADRFASDSGIERIPESAALAVRTLKATSALNRYNRDPGSFGPRPDLDAATAALDAAIADAPPLPLAVSVFRGVDGAPSVANVKPGDVLADRAHLSTSLDRDYAKEFLGGEFPDNVMIQIRVPAGTKALYAGKAHPDYAHERELVLPRGSRLKVESVRPLGRGKYVVADLVGSDPATNSATANALPTTRSVAETLYDLSDEYTRAESRKVARAVLDGYDNDKSVEAVSRQIKQQLGVPDAQAMVLAQTELTRVAAADVLSSVGAAGGKKVRFVNGADPCPLCQALHGKVYTLRRAQQVIPVHPHCSCLWEPLED